MDKLDGVPLTDLAAIRSFTAARDPEEILIGALNTWFGSVVSCRRFHADVHAGTQFCRVPFTEVCVESDQSGTCKPAAGKPDCAGGTCMWCQSGYMFICCVSCAWQLITPSPVQHLAESARALELISIVLVQAICWCSKTGV